MRWPLFIADTPFAVVPTVRLYEDTWMTHILPNHQEVAAELPAIQKAVEQPELICAATSAGYYAFVSGSRLDDAGKPLIVVVNPADSSGHPVVATSYFGNKLYLDPTQTKYTVHWRK
jgi:hypothetical protein